MNKNKLKSIAKKLVAPGKGILAADESMGTIEKRFNSVNVVSTEKTRCFYRGLLFTTPNMERFISGVILFDETIRQKTDNGVLFPKLLKKKGVITGIKVDKKAKDLAGFPGEKITEGLDGLRERLAEYRDLGADFAKWRAVITIGKYIPTKQCLDANAHALARYASLCQEADLVPIVEPEVLMDGNHALKRCEEVTGATLTSVFSELKKYKVFLEGILLKPNMVISGKDCPRPASVKEVAKATLRCFNKVVPKQVPGCVFLSGGLTPDQATERLDEMNSIGIGKTPWELSFSFGRALQQEALQIWKGKAANAKMTQDAFYARAEKVSAARLGRLKK